MRIVLWVVAVICVGTLSWFQFGQHRSLEELEQSFVDIFDGRPAREILLLGNSRTYSNHMPKMLRQIADSAGSPQKYRITSRTPAGSSLEILWNDGYARSLLQQSWDDAIIQAESRAFSSEANTRSFMTYGPKLLGAVRLLSGWPRLVVNWSYESTAKYAFSESDRARFQRQINAGHAKIAGMAGAQLVKLGKVWDDVRAHHPEIALTVDGNHPSLAGSYLYALFLYRELSNDDVAKVGFVPEGLPGKTAAIMKDAVARFSPLGW